MNHVKLTKIRATGKRLLDRNGESYTMNEVAAMWQYNKRLKNSRSFESFDEFCFWLTNGYGRIYNNSKSNIIVESRYNTVNWLFLQQQKEFDLGVRTEYTCGAIR